VVLFERSVEAHRRDQHPGPHERDPGLIVSRCRGFGRHRHRQPTRVFFPILQDAPVGYHENTTAAELAHLCRPELDTVARERRGTQFDPGLVDLFCQQAPALLDDLDGGTNWLAASAAKPELGQVVPEAQLDAALEAIGDFTDLKSPYTIGRSRGGADLAATAARLGGLPEGDGLTLRSAAPGSRTRSGTSAGRSRRRSGSASACTPSTAT
jgi:hypothetical protein